MPLPQREVLHLRGLSTDGVMGRCVLQDARELIGGALATQEHSNTTWKRGGLPSVVLTHPKTLSEKAKDSLEKRWESVYGGSKDQRRVAVIEEGMDLTPLTVSLEDLQFLETQKFSDGRIAGWFFVPPHMVGDTEKSTSWGTGIEQQQIGFLSFTLRPDLVSWEAADEPRPDPEAGALLREVRDRRRSCAGTRRRARCSTTAWSGWARTRSTTCCASRT